MFSHSTFCAPAWHGWSRPRRWGAWVLVTLGLLTNAPAQGAMCVPMASGVPALPGPPNFLDELPVHTEPDYWPRVDDPRWVGALARGFGDAGNPHVTFRALRVAGSSPALYLSWVVKVAPRLNPANDKLRLAFETTGGQAEMIEIQPMPDVLTTNVTAPQPPAGIRAWLDTGSGWVEQAAPPAWVNTKARVWFYPETAPYRWAVNVKVPIASGYDTGIDLPSEFAAAFHLHVTHTSPVPVPLLTEYRLDNSVNLMGATPDRVIGASKRLNIALPGSDPGCEQGISIRASDFVTDNTSPHRINLNGPNTFRIRPTNNTAVQVGASKIAARIRLANWGTQPDWNAGVAATSLWKEITPSSPAALPRNQDIIGIGATATNTNGIRFDWPELTAAQRCEFDVILSCSGLSPPITVATRRLHQCMLVEFEGGGLNYTPASIYRNMDFGTASTFEREAQVSVDGLGPPPGGGPRRDVFLYVQTFQMPRDAAAPGRSHPMLDLAKVRAVKKRPTPHDKLGQASALSATAQGAASPDDATQGDTDFETLNQLLPTYLVHAFHDTGRTLNQGGQTWKLLRPQSSFGYYIRHDGPLSGWDTELQGAEPIAPDYYRIAVAEGAPGSVTTRIVAREDRWAAWLGLGRTNPQGSFGVLHRDGPATTLGLAYAITNARWVEASLSLHRFQRRPANPANSDLDAVVLAANARWDFPVSGLTPFLTLGAGAYDFNPGTTRFGLNAGAGLQLALAPGWSVDARYTRHRVNANAPNSDHSTLQFGLRKRF